jgi:hypothetical protein
VTTFKVKKPPADDVLTINHQDGRITFALEKGGYAIENGAISISIQTENRKRTSRPQCACICIVNHPLEHDLRVGDVFACDGGMQRHPDEPIQACGYFEFHAEHIEVKWTVVAIDDGAVTFALEAQHDDVDYYDARAKRTPTRGRFRLTKKQKRHLWIPQ